MKKLSIIILILATFAACVQEKPVNKPDKDHLIMSTLWFQKSAETQALYYQGFNIAKIMLDKHLESFDNNKKPAVVCDIDETLLDNSPFEGKCIHENLSFSDSLWRAWTFLANANALSGAVEFANYAKSKGVDVFYISNRKVAELEPTMKNMKDAGFPFIEESHFLLKTTTSNKDERRNSVSENHEILLLVGDNLGDFSHIFDNRSDNFGFNDVEKMKDLFGNKFIILPNPMYGTWEKTVFGGTNKLPDTTKDSLRLENIVSF